MKRNDVVYGIDGSPLVAPRRLLTMQEAAEELDRLGVIGDKRSPARWVREYIRRREAELRLRLLVRIGSGKRRPTYRITKANLHLAFPELREGPGDAKLEIILREVSKLARCVESFSEQAEQNRLDLNALAENLRRLRYGT